jgi:hypothetical protein
MSELYLFGRSPVIIGFAAAVMLWTDGAHACSARILTPPVVRIDYDAFALSNAYAVVTFDVENSENDSCTLELALVRDDHIPIEEVHVAETDVRLKATVDPGGGVAASRPGVWAVGVEPLAKTRIALRFDVVGGGIVASGVHGDELLLELREAGHTAPTVNSVPLHLELASPSRAQMNIAGANGSFGATTTVSSVSFGNMQSGDVRRVFLQVRANSEAVLSIDSQNQGKLLLNGQPGESEGITYSLMLSQETIDLSRHWQRQIAPPHTMAGESIPLDLTLGQVGGQPAGTYSDMITIVLSAI